MQVDERLGSGDCRLRVFDAVGGRLPQVQDIEVVEEVVLHAIEVIVVGPVRECIEPIEVEATFAKKLLGAIDDHVQGDFVSRASCQVRQLLEAIGDPLCQDAEAQSERVLEVLVDVQPSDAWRLVELGF